MSSYPQYTSFVNVPAKAQCEICNKKLLLKKTNIVQLQCNHWFHQDCRIETQIDKRDKCPHCADSANFSFKVFHIK